MLKTILDLTWLILLIQNPNALSEEVRAKMEAQTQASSSRFCRKLKNYLPQRSR
jgi:hypothetical protein